MTEILKKRSINDESTNNTDSTGQNSESEKANEPYTNTELNNNNTSIENSNKGIKNEEETKKKKTEEVIEIEEEGNKKVPLTLKKLTEMVIERIRKINRRINKKNNNDSPKKRSYFDWIVNIVLILGALGSLAYMIYIVYMMRKNKSSPQAGISVPGLTEVKKEFEVHSADKFESITYYGKTEVLEEIITKIRSLEIMINYKEDPFIANSVENTSRNFLLYGPAGTGKTFFIKKLAYMLSRKLKIDEKRKIMTKEQFEEYKNSTNFLTDLEKMECKVDVTFIDSSSILSKFVGDSEKTLKNLFEWARSQNDGRYKLIFVDEIDTFMGGNRDSATEHGLSLKNLLLSILDGGNTEAIKSKVIFIGSTNRYKDIPPEFQRRFVKKFFFDLPNDNERKSLITDILKKVEFFEYYQNNIEDWKVKSNGLPHSILIRLMNQMVTASLFTHKKFDGKSMSEILRKEAYNYVNANKSNVTPLETGAGQFDKLIKEYIDDCFYKKTL